MILDVVITILDVWQIRYCQVARITNLYLFMYIMKYYPQNDVYCIFRVYLSKSTFSVSIYRKEMRNSFNTLIVVLTVVDSLLCLFLMTDFTFARAFQLHTVIYTLMYPWFIYPLTNTMLSASILMTVVLALERYIAVCHPLFHRDLVHTHSITKRVALYTVPVVIVSLLINIPKFFETKTVTRNIHDGNMTTYTIDVTELR